jgi:decaprenylphospho-beta-D-ribofuranose 2-oxidase
MGMTGIILEAEFTTEPLKGISMRQQAFAFDRFSGLLEALKTDTKPFSVGWVDFFNERHNLLLTADSHPFPKNLNINEFRLSKPRLTIPETGVNWISPGLMQWYNARYFRKTLQKPESIISLESYFFPLDKLHYWNRLYGRQGFSQYQFVIPETHAETVFKQIFKTIRSSGLKPYLGVLKKHGEIVSPGMISFPLSGYSLAIDFPASPHMPALARQLDIIVAEAGGRIYLAKDALLDADTFDQMYPNSSEFKTFLKTVNPGIMNSLLGKRLKLAGS